MEEARMRPVVIAFVLAASAALSIASAIGQTSPYVGEEARPIKALSAAETADLLAGNGMGLARAAELNGYPGPAHVLDLAAELRLTAEQQEGIAAVRDRMRRAAVALGEAIVAAERALDAAFAGRTVDPAGLEAQVAEIAELTGVLRAVHLAAHLETTALMTAPQIARYDALRGYASPPQEGDHGHRHGG
jgi:hypothetical protein